MNEWIHIESTVNGCFKLLRLSIDEEQLLCCDEKLLDLGTLNIYKLCENKEYNERERKSNTFLKYYISKASITIENYKASTFINVDFSM